LRTALVSLSELNGRGDLVRQTPAVGVAHADQIRTGLRRNPTTLDPELRVLAKAVEEVLGIKDDGVDVPLEKADAVVDHLEVLRLRDAQVVTHVQIPSLADDGDHRRLGLQKHSEVFIVARLDASAPGGAESRDLRLLQVELLDGSEKRLVAWVRGRPATFDVADAELVEAFCNAQLVLDGERDVFGLTAVPQSRVVDFDVPRASHPALSWTPSSIKAWCNERTASSAYLASITNDTLISEVEIIWMLMPSCAKT
jgi:hypothetical protein